MPKKIKITPLLTLLLILIGMGILLRFWKLSELFHFTYDEEIFAFVGKRMFVNHHIPLIGGVTPMHVHVAPYFYWLSGIFLSFSNLDPLGWGMVSAILSGITMGTLFILGRILFDKKVALIAVVIYCFSFYMNIFDRHYWGLVFDGLVSLCAFYSLYKIIRGNERFFLLLAGTLAFGVHTDLSTLTLVVLSGISWFIYKPIVSRKFFVLGISIFFVSFIPLLFFDLRHNFSNSKGILQYIEEVRTGREGMLDESPTDTLLFIPRGLARTLYVFGNTDLARQYSYCANHILQRLHEVPWWMVLVVIVIMINLVWMMKQSKYKHESLGLQLILLLLGSTYLGISLYGIIFKGDLYDHYLGTLFPIFILGTAFVIQRLFKNKILLITVLLVFVVSNMYLLSQSHHRFGYSDKIQAIDWTINKLQNEDFAFDVLGDCFKYNGYRYLFYLRGKEPVKSYVDANFTHLYDRLPSQTHPRYLVVFTNPNWTETESYYLELNAYKRKLVSSAQFGTIEVLIIDNQNLDFVGKF